ncbi:MAG: hydroxymethylbilane synthase [Micropepsaceae bacterium]
MRSFRIGTRGSPLALAQAHETVARLTAAQGWTPGEATARLEIVVIKTSGDRITDRPLSEAGGKGLFVKELEEALFDGRVDMAVHSMKDVPGVLPDGLVIGAALPREDARDALIGAASVEALAQGARVGTTSPRRAAALLNLRPDLRIVLFRGNVQTRLDKLARGEADATLLAMAGLNRLNLRPALAPLAVDAFLPAAGQGVVGLECRSGDGETLALAASINDVPTSVALAAERACLAALDGSCRSAIAIHAAPQPDGTLDLSAAVYALDGSRCETARVVLPAAMQADAAFSAGHALGSALRGRAAALLNL